MENKQLLHGEILLDSASEVDERFLKEFGAIEPEGKVTKEQIAVSEVFGEIGEQRKKEFGLFLDKVRDAGTATEIADHARTNIRALEAKGLTTTLLKSLCDAAEKHLSQLQRANVTPPGSQR